MDTICSTCRWWEYERQRRTKKSKKLINEGMCQAGDKITRDGYSCCRWRDKDNYDIQKEDIYGYGRY